MTNFEILSNAAAAIDFDYDGTNLKTFAEWKKAGYAVKKGQTAFLKVALWRKVDPAITEKEEEAGEKDNRKFKLKTCHLFTPEQVENMEEAAARRKAEKEAKREANRKAWAEKREKDLAARKATKAAEREARKKALYEEAINQPKPLQELPPLQVEVIKVSEAPKPKKKAPVKKAEPKTPAPKKKAAPKKAAPKKAGRMTTKASETVLAIEAKNAAMFEQLDLF